MANPHPRVDQLIPTQFKPGHPPVPGSGGRKRPLSTAYMELMKCKAPQEIVEAMRRFGCKEDATWAQVLAVALAKEALRGSTFAAKEIADRTEGRSPLRVELLSREDHEINISVSFEDTSKLLSARTPAIDVAAESTEELPDGEQSEE